MMTAVEVEVTWAVPVMVEASRMLRLCAARVAMVVWSSMDDDWVAVLQDKASMVVVVVVAEDDKEAGLAVENSDNCSDC